MKVYAILVIFAVLLMAGCKEKIIPSDNTTNQINENVSSVVEKPNLNITNNIFDQIIENNTTDNVTANKTEKIQGTSSSATGSVGDKPVMNEPVPNSCKDEIANNESCTNLIYGLSCQNASLTGKTITLSIKNNLNFDIIFIPPAPYVEEKPDDCTTNCVVQNIEVSSDGIEYVDVNSFPKITNYSGFYVKITCSKLDTDYIDQTFPLSYNGAVPVDTGVDDFFRVKAIAR